MRRWTSTSFTTDSARCIVVGLMPPSPSWSNARSMGTPYPSVGSGGVRLC